MIPSGRFSKAAQALIKGLPGPNQSPTTTNVWGFGGNYSQSVVDPTFNTTYTVRIDQALSDKSKIYGSYSSRDNFRELGYPNLPAPFNNSGYPQDFETHYTRVGWDYTLTSSLLNHLNLGYNRTNSLNFASQIGSPQNLTADGAPNFYGNSFPTVAFDGLDEYSSWGVGNNGDNIDNGARVNDSVDWQKGRHSFKFGVDWRHQQYSVISQTIPVVNFLRSETDVAALGGIPQFQSGNSFASLLLGEVDNSNQTVFNHSPRWNSHYIAGFVEDDIKINARLTLNIGVRYDVDAPRHEAENDTSNFSFTLADPAAGNLPGAFEFGKTCNCNSAWADTWKKDVAPRLGFAYQLPHTNGKAVLRGGGAIIYGPLQYNDFGGAMALGYTQNRGIGSIFTGPGTAGGFTPAFQLDTGYSGFTPSNFAPNTDPGQLTGAPGVFNAVGGEVIVPGDGRPSMTSDWSLQVQDELAQDLILTVGYIGETAQNLRSGDLTNFNNIDPSYFGYGDHLNDVGSAIHTQGGSTTFTPEAGPGAGTAVTINAPYSTFLGNAGQAIRPYKQYDFIQGDCCLENVGHSSYEALATSLSRRFRQGFNLQVSYTWAKNETDADSTIPFSYDSDRLQSQNSADHHAEKSVSIQNIPQTLSISYLYQLPFGKDRHFVNKSRMLDFLVGGWEVGAIQRYQSGQPIDFGCATGIPYYQNCIRYTQGTGVSLASAAYKKNKNGPNYFNGQSWFNPAFRAPGTNSSTDPGVPLASAAFIDQNREGPGWLRLPSAGCADGCSFDPFYFSGASPVAGGRALSRVTEQVTSPIFKSEDFSLIKDFTITEKVKFQFKAEAIDAFNRHRFGVPDINPVDSSQATGFGIPTADDYGPRNLQLTGRINF
jgi:hypothetical protein